MDFVSRPAMSTFSLSRLFVIVSMLVLVIVAGTSDAAAIMSRPQRNDMSSVADAIKYLQELDNYYSQISRPRYGHYIDIYFVYANFEIIYRLCRFKLDCNNLFKILKYIYILNFYNSLTIRLLFVCINAFISMAATMM